MESVRLAVRKLVEHVLCTGDIDNRYADTSAMMLGARAHRMLQKEMGPGYRSEISLQCAAAAGDVSVLVYGRADGIFSDGGLTYVDEIKTTTLPLPRFMEQQSLHIGQAKCYAHMLLQGMQPQPAQMGVQISYYQLETQQRERIRFVFSAEELHHFFQDLLDQYAVWLRFARDWAITRTQSIQDTPFPFPAYREGQRKLAVAAYAAIKSGMRLYAQAPTGTGKTLASLFPAIKALGGGEAEKLFYLTAKTVTRVVAEDALRLMANKGLRIKSVTLRAKEKICFLPEPLCNPEDCHYAKGHYDRVHDALYALITTQDIITPEDIARTAQAHTVCPHELALDASEWADVVIGDYNHVFDPRVYLHRFFECGGGQYVFLIDEAHNLPDRVRGMYTAALRKSTMLALSRELKEQSKHAKKLKETLRHVDKHLLAARRLLEEADSAAATPTALDEALVTLVAQLVAAAQEWLTAERRRQHPLQGQVLQLYFDASFFMDIAAIYSERHQTIAERYSSELVYTLFCLDPTMLIYERLRLARAAILFSATMTPLPYYRELLGGGSSDGMLELRSPFAEQNLHLLAHTGISTRYADREASIAPIAAAISLAISRRRGNYMVYFPSYEYMRAVHAQYTEAYPAQMVLLQQSEMAEEERAEFLARFSADNTETLIGFCVLGGIFAEGIDLVGERLVGAIIVGVGLPRISLRQELIRRYYDQINGDGFAYAYVYPGMIKVLQAAGRVIRTEEDEGVVLLIDSRYATAQYRALFPAHWAHMQLARDVKTLTTLLNN